MNSINSSLICALCSLPLKNELNLGELQRVNSLNIHNFCLLLSHYSRQRGSDEEGIWGFLFPDLLKVLQKTYNIECSFCRHTGASIQCHTCKLPFHLPCGISNGASSVFENQYLTYCAEHRPTQSIPSCVINSATSNPPTCLVCLELVNIQDILNSFWAPCCMKNWFHRKCLQLLSWHQTSHFKCPTCSNNQVFNESTISFGIYIPLRDASWESEPDAFQFLDVRYQYDELDCMCTDGRSFNTPNTLWEVLVCNTCGSRGAHRPCAKLQQLTSEWQCPECQQILNPTAADAVFITTFTQSVESPKLSASLQPEDSFSRQKLISKFYKCDYKDCSSAFPSQHLLNGHKQSHENTYIEIERHFRRVENT